MLTGLAPRRTTVGAVQKVAHRLGEIAQRLLLHRLRSSGQPLVFGARSGQLGALLVVEGRGGRAASAAAARRLDSTRTGHDDSARPILPVAQGREADRKTPRTDNVSATTDNLAERREAAFLPG